MKTYRLLLTAVLLAAIAGFSIQAQTLYNGVGHIPTYYQERQNRAGLLRDMSTHEPKLVINFESLSGNDNQKMVTALNNARSHVQSTGGLAIIYFPTGACTLTTTVPTVPRDSNIVFQGAGSWAQYRDLIFLPQSFLWTSATLLAGLVFGLPSFMIVSHRRAGQFSAIDFDPPTKGSFEVVLSF